MINNFELHTYPKYLVNNICTVCSRVILTKISEQDKCLFPSHYLNRYNKFLHYTNLSYHNIFECNKLFNYVGSHAILNNCVLNQQGFNKDTNQVILKLHLCNFYLVY